jgi:hypothetical protein
VTGRLAGQIKNDATMQIALKTYRVTGGDRARFTKYVRMSVVVVQDPESSRTGRSRRHH